ncbi:MAG: hypothetical protein ACRD3W_22895, partial [Terriglobales bacterium]
MIDVNLKDQAGAYVSPPTPAATIEVHALYTDRAVFASGLLPLGNFTVNALSNGGLPFIDMVLCFDLSGSMDDQTPIYLINRYFEHNGNGGLGLVHWDTVAGGSGAVLFNIFNPNVSGTRVNVGPPMNLVNCCIPFNTSTYTGMNSPYTWTETNIPGYNSANGMRSNCVTSGGQYPVPVPGMPGPATATEQGRAPGNFHMNGAFPTSAYLTDDNNLSPTTYTSASASGPQFTDMIVDVANGGSYPITVNGFAFQSPAAVCEAARGNMESTAALNAAMCNQTSAYVTAQYPSLGTPASGAYNAYWTYVLLNASPIAKLGNGPGARAAALAFFNTMNISANSHFGLVSFADEADTQTNSSYTNWNSVSNGGPLPDSDGATNASISAGYTGSGQGGTGWFGPATFPLPLVVLNQGANNFTACTSAISGSPAGANG